VNVTVLSFLFVFLMKLLRVCYFYHNRGNCFQSGKGLNGLCIFGKMLVVLLCCAHLALILMQETWRWSSSWIEFVCVCVPCFERDDWVPALSLTPHNSGTEKHANPAFHSTFISRQNSSSTAPKGRTLSLSFTFSLYRCIYTWERVMRFLSNDTALVVYSFLSLKHLVSLFIFCQYTSLMLIK